MTRVIQGSHSFHLPPNSSHTCLYSTPGWVDLFGQFLTRELNPDTVTHPVLTSPSVEQLYWVDLHWYQLDQTPACVDGYFYPIFCHICHFIEQFNDRPAMFNAVQILAGWLCVGIFPRRPHGKTTLDTCQGQTLSSYERGILFVCLN